MTSGSRVRELQAVLFPVQPIAGESSRRSLDERSTFKRLIEQFSSHDDARVHDPADTFNRIDRPRVRPATRLDLRALSARAPLKIPSRV